jgi:hypothetical protein
METLYGLLALLVISLFFIWFEDWWEKRKKSKPSTKHCFNCGSDRLSMLRSINIKKCIDCGHEMDWNLNPGQKSLINSNRGDRSNGKKD